MRRSSSRRPLNLSTASSQPAAVVGDPLQHGPDQLGVAGVHREVVPAAAREPVVHRRALAGDPGSEDDAAGSRRGPRRRFEQLLPRLRFAGGQRLARPEQRQPGGLVVVDHQVAALVEARHAGDGVHHVGLLLPERERDPRGRPDRHVGLALAGGAGAQGGRVQVGCPGHDADPGRQPERGGGLRADLADHRADRDQRGQLVSVDAGAPQQPPVVGGRGGPGAGCR